MAESESLFSLEVVVESLTNVIVPCQIPAIAFRLLDFPTLVLQKKEQSSEGFSGSLKTGITIQAGKSCLFKMNKNVLFSQLEATPLYVMLVDVSRTKAKLLASTTLSLVPCFEKVLENIEVHGLDTPAVHGEKGLFELYNLMGTAVARVKLCYRIFSLGGTINGHVKVAEPIAKQKHSSANRVGDQVLLLPRPKEIKSKREILTHGETHLEDKGEDFVQDSNVGTKSKQLSHVETQTEKFHKIEKQHAESGSWENNRKEKDGRKHNVNIARPPPLYYNSESVPIIHKPLTMVQKQIYSGSNTSSINVKGSSTIAQNMNLAGDSRDSTTNKHYRTVSVQTTEQSKSHSQKEGIEFVKCEDMKEDIDLPLINGLLRELLMAKSNILDGAHIPVDQPCINKKATHKPPRVLKTQAVKFAQPKRPHTVQKSCNMKSSPSKLKVNTRPLNANRKGNLIQRQPITFKKANFKIPTTRTQRLREALNKKQQNEDGMVSGGMVTKEEAFDRQSSKQNINVAVLRGGQETKEFACQVGSLASDSFRRVGDGNHETQFKEMGVQAATSNISDVHVSVQHSDLVQFNKGDFPLSAGQTPRSIGPHGTNRRYSLEDNIDLKQLPQTHTNLLGVTTSRPGEELHFSQASNSDWSSHSRKTGTILPVVSNPMLSKYSPIPPARNSRYSKDQGATKPTEAQSSDSESEKERSLLAKPIDVTSSNSSSIEKITQNSRYTKNEGVLIESRKSSSSFSNNEEDVVTKSGDILGSNSSSVEQMSKNSRYERDKPLSADYSEQIPFSESGSVKDHVTKSDDITLSDGSSSTGNSSKNSSFVKDKSIKSVDSQHSENDSVGKANLVTKSVDITLSNSYPVEHDYSDRFDSFESEHTTDKTK